MGEYLLPLAGGVTIGVAVSLMLVLNGRVAGVSGILGGVLTNLFRKTRGDSAWRVLFLLGLFSGGLILRALNPDLLENDLDRSLPLLIVAGLLVGYGTSVGGGCTSGHGICGISRFSPRSILATLIFMVFGILTATVFRLITGGQ